MKLRNSWLYVEITDLVTSFVFSFSHQLKQPQELFSFYQLVPISLQALSHFILTMALYNE